MGTDELAKSLSIGSIVVSAVSGVSDICSGDAEIAAKFFSAFANAVLSSEASWVARLSFSVISVVSGSILTVLVSDIVSKSVTVSASFVAMV